MELAVVSSRFPESEKLRMGDRHGIFIAPFDDDCAICGGYGKGAGRCLLKKCNFTPFLPAKSVELRNNIINIASFGDIISTD